MNDEEFEAQRQRLHVLAERWIKPIGLGWWNVEMTYVRTDFEIKGQPEPDTVGSTTSSWKYAHAHIRWNMPQVKEQTDDELERAFVHELMHIFLSETRMGADHDDWLDHEERVASTLAKAFLWLRDSLQQEPEPEPEPVIVNGVVGTALKINEEAFLKP